MRCKSCGRRLSTVVPYTVSRAPPQSEEFPLSYPLGMGPDGTPVLLAGGVRRRKKRTRSSATRDGDLDSVDPNVSGTGDDDGSHEYEWEYGLPRPASNHSAGQSHSSAMRRKHESDAWSGLGSSTLNPGVTGPHRTATPSSMHTGIGADNPDDLFETGSHTSLSHSDEDSDMIADPIEAFGAFERYSDESGLSAQEELRLLKAQVQDIARVCKVRPSSVRNT